MSKNKTWLITGCSSGFGRELAKYVADQGDRVVATVRKESQIEEINNLSSGHIDSILMDVTNTDQINKGISYINEKYDGVDVLVNNAGYGEIGPIEEISDEKTLKQIDVNVHGPIRLIRAVLPAMRKQKSGHVINVTSIAGLRGGAGLGIYNASKFALEGVGEALAQEVKHLGIHVTNVEPGPFRTKWAGESATYSAEIHPDYKMSAGVFMENLQAKSGNQPGDPVKGAEAMFKLTRLTNPPVHLPIGNFAYEASLKHLENVSEEIRAFEHIGRRTDFDE